MKTILILLVTILLGGVVTLAQDITQSYYWVKLRDKKGTPFLVSKPEEFLSQRAIDRRNRQHIIIDETDLPVSPVYLDSLTKIGFEIIHTSKWLNGATVKIADTIPILKIKNLSFVDSVQLSRPAHPLKSAKNKFNEEVSPVELDPGTYGLSFNQLNQLNGQYLHNQGIRGKGIQIAVLDAGFWHVNEIEAFDNLRTNKLILGTRDMVDPKSDFYQQHTHGMSVLSCMGGYQSGQLIGTAPDAAYYLIRTEDAGTEYLIEEDNWVAGAEWADSLGVDVINSSLGYNEFDDPDMNHAYSDINGQTTRVTQGANMAFQKGILVVCSAGNEANNAWKQIIAPSDGVNVLAVAAVDKDGIRSSFSSVGPAFGGAVKPNVAAMGGATYLVTGSGVLGYSNGTSFSSPVLAGMAACLMQANPYANVKQVKTAIEQSAHQYSKPDSLLGYGIPDFEKADKYLKLNIVQKIETKNTWMVLPNPFSDYLLLKNQEQGPWKNSTISIFNLQGILLWQSGFNPAGQIWLDNLATLPEGILLMSIRSGEKEERFKLIKITR
ncbi:MAG: S8 family serine peptidase [Paludibacter sp.]|nr:MAG: S8 family serine peptidase [Paludibacter sp.]